MMEMKKVIGITIALITVVAVERAMYKRKNKFSFTVTDQNDGLLADITEKDIVFHEDVKVYFHSELID